MIQDDISKSSWQDKSKEDAAAKNGRRWLWPLDAVKILDIRRLREDRSHVSGPAHAFLADIVQQEDTKTKFRAGENMQNMKSSLRKIGMNIDQEKVVVEEDMETVDGSRFRPAEGSRPRIFSGSNDSQNSSTEKISNVFHARSRDAGISASWTRFSRQESLEKACE